MMRIFGKRIDVPGGRRRSPRQRVTLAGAAIALEGSRSVIINDVCSTGLKLRGRDLPKEGAELMIRIGDSDVLARVIWKRHDDCGVSFEDRLDPATVDHLKHEGQLGRLLGLI